MSILDKANEVIGQITGFATVSLGEIVGSAFMRVVFFNRAAARPLRLEGDGWSLRMSPE